MIRITWGKSPEWFGRNPRLTKGHYRCTANLCYQVKLRYEASQSVVERNLYSTLSAIIGLAVETWRVKTELIIITILHIIIITTSILNLDSKNICAKNIGAQNMHKWILKIYTNISSKIKAKNLLLNQTKLIAKTGQNLLQKSLNICAYLK